MDKRTDVHSPLNLAFGNDTHIYKWPVSAHIQIDTSHKERKKDNARKKTFDIVIGMEFNFQENNQK